MRRTTRFRQLLVDPEILVMPCCHDGLSARVLEQAGFAVLKAPDIPSVLVEAAFISNPEEEVRLNSEAYQQQLADALMRGIVRYFARNPPLARNRPI